MFSDISNSLLRRGILEAKEGERNVALRYLVRVIYSTNDRDTLAEAWYWMAVVTDDPTEKREMLENALSYDLLHARARRELALLDGKLEPDEIIDADALTPIPEGVATVDADRFMCPKCGGCMTFMPDGRSLTCEFCTSRQALGVSDGNSNEKDFFITMATARGHRKPVTIQTFKCEGCGADFLLPPSLISVICAYCKSPHVVRMEKKRELIEPDGIIPHAFDQHQTELILVEWLKKHDIEPQGGVNPPSGLYLPIWTFDVGGEIEYSGEVVDYQVPGGQARTVKGFCPVQVNDLPIPASRKLGRCVSQILKGYQLKSIQPYDPRYLADWPTEVYDIPMADASLDARDQAYSMETLKLMCKIGPVENLKTSSARLAIESFKLVLLPVWVASYPYGGKDYLVIINGQTGDAKGELLGKPGSLMD